MKKIFLYLSICFIMFFASYSERDKMASFPKQNEETADLELANLEENYEANLKGYVVSGSKDEKTPYDGVETEIRTGFFVWFRV